MGEYARIYKLEIVEAEPLGYRCRKRYPAFDVRSSYMAFGTTLEEAEELMRFDIERRKDGDWTDVMCYYIREVAMRRLCFSHEYLSLRMYDGAGILQEQSCCSSACFCDMRCERDEQGKIAESILFHGHPKDKIRFAVGDIVEVLLHGKMQLAVVAGTPITEEWCREHDLGDPNEGCYRDDSDDNYLVLDGPGFEWHHHVPCCEVFAPHYPIPPYLFRRYDGFLDKALEKERIYNRTLQQ